MWGRRLTTKESIEQGFPDVRALNYASRWRDTPAGLKGTFWRNGREFSFYTRPHTMGRVLCCFSATTSPTTTRPTLEGLVVGSGRSGHERALRDAFTNLVMEELGEHRCAGCGNLDAICTCAIGAERSE